MNVQRWTRNKVATLDHAEGRGVLERPSRFDMPKDAVSNNEAATRRAIVHVGATQINERMQEPAIQSR